LDPPFERFRVGGLIAASSRISAQRAGLVRCDLWTEPDGRHAHEPVPETKRRPTPASAQPQAYMFLLAQIPGWTAFAGDSASPGDVAAELGIRRMPIRGPPQLDTEGPLTFGEPRAVVTMFVRTTSTELLSMRAVLEGHRALSFRDNRREDAGERTHALSPPQPSAGNPDLWIDDTSVHASSVSGPVYALC